jgi:osmotically-inducible protein OsmY
MAVAAPVRTRTDSQIHESVIRELKWDSRVKETDVGVEVNAGIVTLTGMVENYAEKMAAEKAAHRVFGVLDVANDVQVRPVFGGEPTDTDIAQSVRNALKWDAFVPDDRITSTVANGFVTLNGDVPLWSQRDEAERVVSRLRGVRGVINMINVMPVMIDPDFVRTEIEEALERQAEREARRIKVEVVDGTLKLSGTVRTWDEMRAVRGVASHAPGVRTVQDNLRVDPYA